MPETHLTTGVGTAGGPKRHFVVHANLVRHSKSKFKVNQLNQLVQYVD